MEAIASEPEPASVDWKTGAIDIPVEVIPMDDDERDKKRGSVPCLTPSSSHDDVSHAGKKKRARKRDESPPPSKRQAVGSKQRPKRRSPSPVPPTDDEVETEAQKKERCARGVPRRCLHTMRRLQERKVVSFSSLRPFGPI